MAENSGKLVLCMMPQMTDGDTIPWKKWPMPVTEAVEQLLLHLSEESKREVTNYPRGAMFQLTGLGRYIRNNLGLWAYARAQPGFEPDGKSWFMMEALWDRLNESDTYRGVLRNPATGEDLPEAFRFMDCGDYWKKEMDRVRTDKGRCNLRSRTACQRKLLG